MINLNTQISDSLADTLISQALATNRISLSLYEGSPITYSTFNVLPDTEKQQVGLGTHPSYSALVSADFVGLNSIVSKVSINNNPSVRISLANSIDRVLIPSAGTVTWFCMYVGPTDASLYPTSGYSLSGTVGLKSSGSDMEVLNTNLTAGDEMIFLDINIQMPKNITSI